MNHTPVECYEQDLMDAIEEDIGEMINECGYFTKEQFVRIAVLAGGLEEIENDSL